jgi:lipopolysaccharide/colanic/teichoic acid biosynthesis glycosyltransferase
MSVKLCIKRIFDVLVSFITLILLSPVFIIIGFIIYIKLGSPIFFIHKRPGKNEKVFKMIKFRSMKDKRDENGNQLPDDQRMTKFGRILRSTSLDEIPELINVLKGDMSLVGPRPLIIEYLPIYNEKQSKRHDVLPGITGWAQINGRNSITWGQKFELDIWYIEHWSLWLDLKILLMTIKKVLIREGINSTASVTMEMFNGRN